MARVHVSAMNGDDSRTYVQAQNPATPWRTHAKVVQAGSGFADGDEVKTFGGRYAEAGVFINRNNGLWFTEGYVEIDPSSNIFAGAFQFDNTKSGNTFRGYVIRSPAASFGGNAAFGLYGTNNALEDCEIYQIGSSGVAYSIGVAVGFAGLSSTNCAIRRTKIHLIGGGSTASSTPRAAIAFYGDQSTGAIIEHCSVVADSGALIHFGKGISGSNVFAVKNNIFIGDGPYLYWIDGAWAPIGVFATKFASNNNFLYRRGVGTATAVVIGGSTYPDLASFQAATGDEVGSSEANPQMADESMDMWGLAAGSPALNFADDGGAAGASGESIARYRTTPWNGGPSPYGWTLDASTGLVVPTNEVELTGTPSGDAVISVPSGGKIATSVRFKAEEETVTGVPDACRIIDAVNYVPGAENPMEVEIEQTDSATPTGAWSTVTRGSTFAGSPGAWIHLRFRLRDNGRARKQYP